MYIQIQTLLSLYAAGRTGNIIVYSGDGVTQVRILKDEPFYIILIIIYNLYQYFFKFIFSRLKSCMCNQIFLSNLLLLTVLWIIESKNSWISFLNFLLRNLINLLIYYDKMVVSLISITPLRFSQSSWTYFLVNFATPY